MIGRLSKGRRLICLSAVHRLLNPPLCTHFTVRITTRCRWTFHTADGRSWNFLHQCFCSLNCLLTYHLLHSPAHPAHSHLICSHPRSPTMLFIWLLDQPTFLAAHLLAQTCSNLIRLLIYHHIHLPAQSPSYLLTWLLAHLLSYSFICWPTCLYTYFLFALLLQIYSLANQSIFAQLLAHSPSYVLMSPLAHHLIIPTIFSFTHPPINIILNCSSQTLNLKVLCKNVPQVSILDFGVMWNFISGKQIA